MPGLCYQTMPRTGTNLANAHGQLNVDNVFHPPWWVKASNKYIFERKYKTNLLFSLCILHPYCQFSRTYLRTIIVTDRVDRYKYVQTDAIGKVLQLFRKFFQNPTTSNRTDHSKLVGWNFRRRFISILTETRFWQLILVVVQTVICLLFSAKWISLSEDT